MKCSCRELRCKPVEQCWNGQYLKSIGASGDGCKRHGESIEASSSKQLEAKQQGCYVTVIDVTTASPLLKSGPRPRLQVLEGSITADLSQLFSQAIDQFGVIQCCIALASLDLSVLEQSESICDMQPSTWQKVFDVNIHGTFNTCQQWLRGIRDAAVAGKELHNVSLIIMGSEAGRYGVRTMAAYAAGKAAVQYGLLPSLAKDAPRIWPSARVNAVAPGAVDTDRFKEEVKQFGNDWKYMECEATVPLAKPVPVEDVARTILFLASERYSGSIHGQLIPIDAGKMGSLVWTQSELAQRR
ncbi:hypothetical protein AMS68_007350 [Peltaster fructicola]|uniref:NAD(P)-binding protein n=1 Tax=Peltaster fructicola TaxID=286661 RepID=A0A6H0Y4A2_9PEZI|nr:hypothetical protein AMS68_007350 [Peltaster fructicola]